MWKQWMVRGSKQKKKIAEDATNNTPHAKALAGSDKMNNKEKKYR